MYLSLKNCSQDTTRRKRVERQKRTQVMKMKRLTVESHVQSPEMKTKGICLKKQLPGRGEDS